MHAIWRLSALVILALSLGGCATRGRLSVDCDDFPRFVRDLPYSPLEEQIRNSWPPQPQAFEGSGLALGGGEARDYDRAIDKALSTQRRAEQAPRSIFAPRWTSANPVAQPSVLLLSGGGQWGAFGAGLLTTLAQDGSSEMPNPVAITGVSTGALQMLFVGAGLDDPLVRDALRRAYAPAKESDVVDRQWKGLAVVTGAISGLKPLRRRIEDALCSDAALRTARKAGAAPACPLLDRLATTDTLMFSGFVEASSGRFQYADINAMARAEDLSAAQRRTCIAGAALASVAMPVFFQQVSVGGKTYFDGGVRQSVFATHIYRRMTNRMIERHLTQGVMPLLVLRNGPTDVEADLKADRTRNALDAALRAEAIVVNQVEVSSVAALRLQDPSGYLGFASADGWRDHLLDTGTPNAATCGALKAADKEAQFAPAFMRCLMAYGDSRARERRVWLPLITVGPPAIPLPKLPPPANDNEQGPGEDR